MLLYVGGNRVTELRQFPALTMKPGRDYGEGTGYVKVGSVTITDRSAGYQRSH